MGPSLGCNYQGTLQARARPQALAKVCCKSRMDASIRWSGVGPSPGAATLKTQIAAKNCGTLNQSCAAAPGDRRAPRILQRAPAKRGFNRRVLCLLGVSLLLASTAASEPKSSTAVAAPTGWQTGAPREEIRPEFAFDPQGGCDRKGCLIIR